jgi:hypothetical protein
VLVAMRWDGQGLHAHCAACSAPACWDLSAAAATPYALHAHASMAGDSVGAGAECVCVCGGGGGVEGCPYVTKSQVRRRGVLLWSCQQATANWPSPWLPNQDACSCVCGQCLL